MSEVQNLTQQDAIKKLQEITGDARVGMLCTNLTSTPFSTCPMSIQQVEDGSGTMWFFSGAQSQHTRDIQTDSRVQLVYADTGSQEYLSIYGTAEVLDDRTKVEELWSPLAKVWFQGGKDDPNLRLIKVTPQEGFYWDTKHGKMVSFLKMLASLVTGTTMDDGLEGQLSIQGGSDAAGNQSVNLAKAKMPTPKQTMQSMKGKVSDHDADLLHGEHSPLDAATDPAVNIIKSDDTLNS